MTIVKYRNSIYKPMLRRYENGNIAIELLTYRTMESNGIVATTNLGVKLPEDYAFIKDYSENEGILRALVEAGVVKEIIGYEKSGFVAIPIVLLDVSKLGLDKDSR